MDLASLRQKHWQGPATPFTRPCETPREKVRELASYAAENSCELLTTELDVSSQEFVDKAVQTIVGAQGRIDVVIHNAGHMTFGPLEAFTPEQIASEYDINVVSTQRVNRVALPVMRKQRSGLLF